MDVSTKSNDTKDNSCWIRMLVNAENGKALTGAISCKAAGMKEITWLSPLEELRYQQYRLYQEPICEQLNLTKEALEMLPMNQPLWDAIGIAGDTIILVESASSDYMIGSALSYLDKLKSIGCKAKLILLKVFQPQNRLDTSDYDPPPYKQIIYERYGRMDTPEDVILLDYFII